jgi:hypothetical protein
MLVNPAKHPHVKKDLGQAFINYLVSDEGQKAIAGYKIEGQQLFFPNANVPGRDDYDHVIVLKSRRSTHDATWSPIGCRVLARHGGGISRCDGP